MRACRRSHAHTSSRWWLGRGPGGTVSNLLRHSRRALRLDAVTVPTVEAATGAGGAAAGTTGAAGMTGGSPKPAAPCTTPSAGRCGVCSDVDTNTGSPVAEAPDTLLPDPPAPGGSMGRARMRSLRLPTRVGLIFRCLCCALLGTCVSKGFRTHTHRSAASQSPSLTGRPTRASGSRRWPGPVPCARKRGLPACGTWTCATPRAVGWGETRPPSSSGCRARPW
jgi:hypothetical protein